MKSEHLARFFVTGLLVGLPLAILAARWFWPARAEGRTVEIHGRMAEAGGWTPSDLSVQAGEKLRLRLTSDDVMHGFAVGQSDQPALDVKPGEVTEVELTFDRPGKYVFYCTRWCGANHWRMRGTIEVTGEGAEAEAQAQPLYAELGLDIDAPHPAAVIPGREPSAARGAELELPIPESYLTAEAYRSRAPAQTWQALRADPFTRELTDDQVWDLVALVWQSNTTPEALAEGEQLYNQNCAACHGETGGGDGVMAEVLVEDPDHLGFNHDVKPPADFSDPATMLGANPALLQGKILRGGMGTGMPYFGPVLTERQIWTLVDYLWTFQFQNGER